MKECETFTIKKNSKKKQKLKLFSKLVEKVNLSERKFEEMGCFEEQKGIKYTWDNVYFDIIVFSSLRSTKPCIRFLFICFAREIKGVHQSSLGNEVDFRDRMNITPNIVAKIKISKSETGFCRWKSTANKDINIFKSLRNPGIFLLAKEKP